MLTKWAVPGSGCLSLFLSAETWTQPRPVRVLIVVDRVA
jgi:hypothetical protein